MDRLIQDYKKALTEEFELREPVVQARLELRDIAARAMVRIFDADDQLLQWKAKEIHAITLRQHKEYRGAAIALREAEFRLGSAGIRLLVVTKRLELAKARLGGRNEVLDMQEVGPVDDETVA